jgi:hypothetical protein
MRTTLKGILIGVVLLASAGRAFAYPPDNAAVLYYKSFMLMEATEDMFIPEEPNNTLNKMLAAVRNGEAKPDDQVCQYVKRNYDAIKEIVTAAQIKNCDWGLDFSEGLSTLMPHLAKYRSAAYLLATDAMVIAEKGDYKTALDRCITIHKMGGHVGDDTIVQGLVGIAISRMANKCIVDILPQVSTDPEMLEWLRAQLADVSSRYPSIRTAIGNDAGVYSNSINREGLRVAGFLVYDGNMAKIAQDKLNQILHQQDDNEFYARSREYYQNVMSKARIAYDLPYLQGKKALEDLYKEVENTAKEKPEAVITEVLLPDINGVLMTDTTCKAQFNAVLAGVEIYIIRAKTGKLPDELPAGLPRDLFSGKDFLYEKTDTGFTLTGQGKGLKGIVQKYEFKVAK